MEFHGIGRPELRALTGLRGVAATVVALAHFRPPLPYDFQLFLLWHSAAVDLFFCLSGFTLSYVYSRDRFRFSDYLAARIARIYPLYFVTLIVGAVIYFWGPMAGPATFRMALQDFLLQALMLNSWPEIGSGVHWNFPAWSISIEWFCYVLLFPLLLHIEAPRSENCRLVCLIALSAVSASLFIHFIDLHITEPVRDRSTYWANMARGVLGFTAGWIAFASFEKRDGLYSLCARYSGQIWLCFAAILVLWYYGRIHSQMLVLLFPFVTLSAADPTSITSRLLGSRPIHFLGIISYSIYMIHALVLAVFIRARPDVGTWPLYLYGTLIVGTFVISIGSYFAIEMPARNAIRDIASGLENCCRKRT